MSERPPLMMVRRGTFLAPYSPSDGERLAELPAMKLLNVRVSQARSVPQHRLYWSMLSLVCENLDQALSPEDLHQWVKLTLGHKTPIRLKNGEIAYVPGSIAFDKMPQAEFQAFFDAAKTLLVEKVIPGLGKDALEREARLMLGEAV